MRRIHTLTVILALLTACSADDPQRTPTFEDYRASAEEALGLLNGERFQDYLQTLADDAMEGRDNLTAGGERAREYLVARLAEIGLEPMGVQGYEQPFDEGVNLVALLAGSDPELAPEFVILSAHYDHLGVVGDSQSQCESDGTGDSVCNGAADNAAGVSAVLELARAFAESRLGTRRSLLVIFWDAEEDGLLGSRFFAHQAPLVSLHSVAAMFTVDTVGSQPIPGVDAAFALGMDYSDGLRELIHANNAVLGTSVYPVSLNFAGGSGGRSDHKPFQEEGVPIAFFGSGWTAEYHTPADEIDVVDTDLALQLMGLVLLVTADVANLDARPVYVAGPRSHIDDAIALRDLGEAVLADPEGVGLDDDNLISILEEWVDQLNAYIESPPQTQEEWDRYQSFINIILAAVYAFIG